jgi:hypothetical protein
MRRRRGRQSWTGCSWSASLITSARIRSNLKFQSGAARPHRKKVNRHRALFPKKHVCVAGRKKEGGGGYGGGGGGKGGKKGGKKGGMMPLMMMFQMKAAMMGAIALKFVGLIAFKALLVAKVALTIAIVVTLKKLVENKHSTQTYEVVAHPHEDYSHYDRVYNPEVVYKGYRVGS